MVLFVLNTEEGCRMKGSIVFVMIVLMLHLLPHRAEAVSAPPTEWTKTFGGDGDDSGRSVQQTSDQGYIVAGYTASSGAGGSDVYLIKTDRLGNMQWSRTFGGSSNDYGYSLDQTSDGGYIIAGSTESSGAGSSDVYLIKTDTSGNVLWSRTFGGTASDCGHSVQQTPDQGYIIAGYTASSGNGGYDVYLIKTNRLGITRWEKTFGGSDNDYGYSVDQTSDGGYIIAGVKRSPWDSYVIKTDSSGNMEWETTLGICLSRDGAYSVQQTSDEGYVIAGYTQCAALGDDYKVYLKKIGGGSQWERSFVIIGYLFARSVQQTSDGGYIIAYNQSYYGLSGYLIKTDGSGHRQWEKYVGCDYPYQVQQTSNGGYIIAGKDSGDVYLSKLRPDETGAIHRSGSAINSFMNGHDHYSIADSAFPPDGCLLDGDWFTSCEPVYNFFLPDKTNIDYLRVKVYGRGTFDTNITIGDDVQVLDNEEGWNEFTYPDASSLPLLYDTSDGIGSRLQIVIDATGHNYDIKEMYVSYGYNGLGAGFLDDFQVAYGAYRAIDGFKTDVVHATWGLPANASEEIMAQAVMKTGAFCQSFLGIDGSLYNSVKAFFASLDAFRDLAYAIEQWADFIAFWGSWDGGSYCGYPSLAKIENDCEDAATACRDLAALHQNVAFDGIGSMEEAAQILSAVTTAKDELVALKNTLHLAAYKMDMEYHNGYLGSQSAQLSKQSMSPMLRYEEENLTLLDSYLPNLIDELEVQASQYVTVSFEIHPSDKDLYYTIDGTDYATNQTFVWFSGTVHEIGAPFEQVGNDTLTYEFDYWIPAGPLELTISPTEEMTYAIYYTIGGEYTLAVSSGADGSVTNPGEGAFWYDYETYATIQAEANIYYRFVNWTGTGVDAGKVTDPDSASTEVYMDDGYTVRANFEFHDTDGDGLPDDWENTYFGDLSHTAQGDDDIPQGDGRTNEEEYVAGTDPTDSNSLFAMTNIEMDPGLSTVTISWSSVSGKEYALYVSDFAFGEMMPWTLVLGNIPASGTGTNTWVDDGSLTGGMVDEWRYYKVRVDED